MIDYRTFQRVERIILVWGLRRVPVDFNSTYLIVDGRWPGLPMRGEDHLAPPLPLVLSTCCPMKPHELIAAHRWLAEM